MADRSGLPGFSNLLITADDEQLQHMIVKIEEEQKRRRNWLECHWLLVVLSLAWLLFSPWTIESGLNALFSDAEVLAIEAVYLEQLEKETAALLEPESASFPVLILITMSWALLCVWIPCRWGYLGIRSLILHIRARSTFGGS